MNRYDPIFTSGYLSMRRLMDTSLVAMGWLLLAGLSFVSLSMLSPMAAHGQESELQPLNEGFLIDKKQDLVFYFQIRSDSSIILTENVDPVAFMAGVDEGAKTMILSWTIGSRLNRVMNSFQADETQLEERVQVSYQDRLLHFSMTKPAALVAGVMGGGFIGGLLLIFSVVTYRRLQREREKHQALLERQRLMLESRERERLHLAREIHDGPVQDLNVLNMDMVVWKKQQELDQAGQEQADAIKGGVLEVMRELRAICQALRPPTLKFGLSKAIQGLVGRMRHQHSDISINAYIDDDGQHLNDTIRLALFRICQEGLNNAVQHGKAENITVLFRVSDTSVYLRLEDDGAGFAVPEDWLELGQKGHYGMLGISERASAIGASLSVSSKVGEGTTIEVVAPYRVELDLHATASSVHTAHADFGADREVRRIDGGTRYGIGPQQPSIPSGAGG